MIRSRDPDILFSKGSIIDLLESHKQKALDEIRNLSANQVIPSSTKIRLSDCLNATPR